MRLTSCKILTSTEHEISPSFTRPQSTLSFSTCVKLGILSTRAMIVGYFRNILHSVCEGQNIYHKLFSPNPTSRRFLVSLESVMISTSRLVQIFGSMIEWRHWLELLSQYPDAEMPNSIPQLVAQMLAGAHAEDLVQFLEGKAWHTRQIGRWHLQL